jgi:hypothetical protein
VKAQEVIQIIRSTLEKLKAGGQQNLTITNLEAYLKEFEGRLTQAEAQLGGELRVEVFKAVHEVCRDAVLSGENTRLSNDLEMFRAVIKNGQNSVKTCLLINGGAVVSLLTFVGHIVTNSSTKPLVKLFAYPLGLFVGGVFLAGVTNGAIYFAQRAFQNRRQKEGDRLNALCTGLLAIAYGLFIWGSIWAIEVFVKL